MRNMRIRTLGLALVAVFAMGATGSATASAASQPEIVNSAGKTPVKTGFTSTSEASTFETKSKEAVTCKKDTNKGKITGSSSDEATISFTGCTGPLGLKCKTEGAKAEEIVLKVESKLVWLNKNEKTEPGEDLVLPSELTIKCTSTLFSEMLKVKGSTLCPITPFEKLSPTLTLTCKQTGGSQAFKVYFLGGKEIKDVTETEGTGTKNSHLRNRAWRARTRSPLKKK